jgi:hypothetical protein
MKLSTNIDNFIRYVLINSVILLIASIAILSINHSIFSAFNITGLYVLQSIILTIIIHLIVSYYFSSIANKI